MRRYLMPFLITFILAFIIINWGPVKNALFLKNMQRVDWVKPLLVSSIIVILLYVDRIIRKA
jgi:hypothetical protein